MSGPTHLAHRKDNRLFVEVYGRKRKRYAQEIADQMVASYERAALVNADHPSYAFTITEAPSQDIKAENERLHNHVARDAKTIATLEERLTAVSKVADRLDEHPALEGEPVEARDATGWWDVADTLRATIATN